MTRTYQRIEELRLGGRLEVVWKLDTLPMQALVPGLTLQPLLENAIYHGIEPRRGGGVVTITGELANGLITIVVRNPVPESSRRLPGAKETASRWPTSANAWRSCMAGVRP